VNPAEYIGGFEYEAEEGPERDAVHRRSPQLVAAILDAIYDDPEPIPWTDLVDNLAGGNYKTRTIDAAIYDLIAYGALHRTGKPATRRQPDTRHLRQTPLGRAWWTGTELPERPTP
jgi:hypothetical protein